MTKCEYCNNEIKGLPWKNKNGKYYCDEHRIPESRGEHGDPIEFIQSVKYSGGSVSIINKRSPKKSKPKKRCTCNKS